MKQSDIRNSFHKLIDEIDNEHLLMKFYDLLIKSSDQKEGELWNQLSDEQKNEVLLAESESHYQNNIIDHETQKAKHKKWL
ncbi:MAG TPA: hypothetical protein ENI20_08625 [Bacteroides sp.]|nr:hypothetical protein [Bacteroides sp.]